MTHFLVLGLALLLGMVAGLRMFTAPAVLCWAGMLGLIDLDRSWALWLGHPVTLTLFTLAAIVEMITDQLARTRPRTALTQFGGRLIMGGVAGALLGSTHGYTVGGIGAGITGAALGTIAGVALKRRFAGGHPLFYGLIEDAVAVLAGLSIAASVGAV